MPRKKKQTSPKEPPRGQYKGPFSKGPRAYVLCPMCTFTFPRRVGSVGIGVAKQHVRSHLKLHRLGKIRDLNAREGQDAEAVAG